MLVLYVANFLVLTRIRHVSVRGSAKTTPNNADSQEAILVLVLLVYGVHECRCRRENFIDKDENSFLWCQFNALADNVDKLAAEQSQCGPSIVKTERTLSNLTELSISSCRLSGYLSARPSHR